MQRERAQPNKALQATPGTVLPAVGRMSVGGGELHRLCSYQPEEVALKVREVLKLLEDDGWRQVRMKGSHRQFKHPAKVGLVTVPGRSGDDLAVGTLNSILKQAGLKT